MEIEAESLAIKIEKLKVSEPVISTGLEYDELYELSNRAAEKYIRDNLWGNYLNTDTGDVIRITRKGAEKVTRHDAESHVHLKSIALIPELIRRSVFIAEVKNEKQVNEYDSFRYYLWFIHNRWFLLQIYEILTTIFVIDQKNWNVCHVSVFGTMMIKT